jgi:hypothetical protein
MLAAEKEGRAMTEAGAPGTDGARVVAELGPRFAERAAAHDATACSCPTPPSACAAPRLLVGEMDNELTAARLAVRHMIEAADTDRIGPETANVVTIGRTLAGRAAIRAT